MSVVVSPFTASPAPPPPRVLIFSQRGLDIERWQCSGLELEDVIAAIDDAEIVAPVHKPLSRQRQKLIRALSRYLPARMLPRPGLSGAPRHAKYDVLFAEVGNAGDLLALNAIGDWRKRCRVAVCFVQEIFLSYLPKLREQLKILNQFDLVFCGCAATVEPLSERLGKAILHLPFGVDAIRFKPRREFKDRFIDVAMIGRQSAITHRALAEYAKRTGAFYYSDTTHARRMLVKSHADHRELLANIVKNSRFFIANKANFDRADKIAFQQELGPRFFEGLAGGAVLLGDPPRTKVFDTEVGWQDSVIPIPIDCPDIGSIIEDLDKQPYRLERISRRNVKECLARHDWSYRWRTVLDAVGLPPTEMALQREAELSAMAAAYADDLPQACTA